MSFIRELKRRRVVRVAIVYGAAAFGVLQAADVLVPALRLPSTITTAVAALSILGFPIAMVLAWAFQITPDGVQRTESIDDAAPSAGAVEPGWIGRRTVIAAAIPLLIGVGLGAGWVLQPIASDARSEAAIPSIAALPFESLSATEEDRYFTDGMHDEILTQLSRIGSMRVISRTSVMQYRAADRNLSEIASALGARYILEGSVRRGGERVRVTAQLIDARNDSHVWAETYDRSLDDVLAIQSDVATRIAAAMHATLTPQEKSRIEGRQNADKATTDLYLRARGLAGEYGVQANNERAIELFRQAIQRTPTYAPAWAGLADAYAARVLAHGYARAWADSALAAADHAIRLDPELAEGHDNRGLTLVLLGRLRDAGEANRRALALNPNAANVYDRLGWIEREVGRFDVALRNSQTAATLDPTAADVLANVGSNYRSLNEFERAEQLALRTLAMQQTNPWAHTMLVYMDLERGRNDSARARAATYLALDPENITALYLAGDAEAWSGNWEASRRIFQKIYDKAPDGRLAGIWWSGRLGLGSALHQLGRTQEAAPHLAQALRAAQDRLDRGEEYPLIYVEISLVHAIRGDSRAALEWLQRAYDAGWRFTFPAAMPHYAALKGDAEFQQIMTRIDADVAAMRRAVNQ